MDLEDNYNVTGHPQGEAAHELIEGQVQKLCRSASGSLFVASPGVALYARRLTRRTKALEERTNPTASEPLFKCTAYYGLNARMADLPE